MDPINGLTPFYFPYQRNTSLSMFNRLKAFLIGVEPTLFQLYANSLGKNAITETKFQLGSPILKSYSFLLIQPNILFPHFKQI